MGRYKRLLLFFSFLIFFFLFPTPKTNKRKFLTIFFFFASPEIPLSITELWKKGISFYSLHFLHWKLHAAFLRSHSILYFKFAFVIYIFLYIFMHTCLGGVFSTSMLFWIIYLFICFFCYLWFSKFFYKSLYKKKILSFCLFKFFLLLIRLTWQSEISSSDISSLFFFSLF